MAVRLNLQEKIKLIESIILSGTPGSEIQPLFYSLLDMLEEDDADDDGYRDEVPKDTNDAIFTEYRLSDILVDHNLASTEEDAFTLIGDKRVRVAGNLITNPHYPIANADIEEDGFVEVRVDYPSTDVTQPEDTAIAVARINIYGPTDSESSDAEIELTFQIPPSLDSSDDECDCDQCLCGLSENTAKKETVEYGSDEDEDQIPVIRFPYSDRLTVGEVLNQSGAIPFSQQMGGDTVVVNGVLCEYSTTVFGDALQDEAIFMCIQGEPFMIEVA